MGGFLEKWEVMETIWTELRKSVNKPTKTKLVDFYHELQVYVDEEAGIENTVDVDDISFFNDETVF